MTGFRANHSWYARRGALVLLGAGAVSACLWVLVERSALPSAVAELPQVAAATCVLSALSLYATSRTGRLVQRRLGAADPSVVWPSTVSAVGVACVTLLVALSAVLLANGVLYLALDRQWPITSSRAGTAQFYVLALIVLAPLAVGLVASIGFAASRARRSWSVRD